MTTQVQSEILADGSVTTTQLAASAVTTAKLADANVTPAKLSQPLVQGTAQASTSGTSIDFTGIPSWAKRITIMFNAVSMNGTSPGLVQIGAGSVTNTGYTSYASTMAAASSTLGSSTAGFIIQYASASATLLGHMVLTNVSGNIWVSSHQGAVLSTNTVVGGGVVTLSGTLDRVRITTVNGTDTFDAGSVNILYEG